MHIQETKENYAEVERNILGPISSLPFTEAMSAREIADPVGCSTKQTSLQGSNALSHKGLINIDTRD